MSSVEKIGRQEESAVGAMIGQGLTLIRAENDSMQSVAVLRPRDEKKIITAALGELDIAPEYASKVYYSIPYKDRKENKTVFVTGLSIHAAIGLARRWGNCTTTARVINEDAEGADIEGYFLDYETNFRIGRPHRASRYFKLRDGRRILLDEQRWLMAVQASASKAQRNAILAGLPQYLREAYFAKAWSLVSGGDPNKPASEAKVKAIVAAFTKKGVELTKLEEYLEKKAADWTGEEVAQLRGCWQALEDGQVTAKEVFDPEPVAATAPPPAVFTPDSLTGGTVVSAQDNPPEPTGAKPPEPEKEPLVSQAPVPSDVRPTPEPEKKPLPGGFPLTEDECDHAILSDIVMKPGKIYVCNTCGGEVELDPTAPESKEPTLFPGNDRKAPQKVRKYTPKAKK